MTRQLWQRPTWDLISRIDALETRIKDLEMEIHGVTVAVFSIVGSVSAPFFPTHRFYVEHDYEIRQARVSVGTPTDSGSAQATIYIDNGPLTSITIPDSDYSGMNAFEDQTIEEGSFFTVSVDSSPGSESDWTFQVRMLRIQ